MTDEQPQSMPLTHEWVGATYVSLTEQAARYAARRGVWRVPEQTKIDVPEVLCSRCRKTFEQVGTEPCKPTPWLHGGPIGTRKRRKKMIGDDGLGPDRSLAVAT